MPLWHVQEHVYLVQTQVSNPVSLAVGTQISANIESVLTVEIERCKSRHVACNQVGFYLLARLCFHAETECVAHSSVSCRSVLMPA